MAPTLMLTIVKAVASIVRSMEGLNATPRSSRNLHMIAPSVFPSNVPQTARFGGIPDINEHRRDPIATAGQYR